MNVIVDASVAVKWFFEEDRALAAHAFLDGPDPLHAPETLPLEVISVLCRRIKRKEITLAQAISARADLKGAPVLLYPILDLVDTAFSLAVETRCRPYDCLYLALAVILPGRMVTDDERLCRSLAGGPFANHILWIGDVR